MQKLNALRGLFAISPIIVLLTVYLCGSIIAGDFYRIPIAVAFLVAAIYAIAIAKEGSINERIDTFSKGAANTRIMYMVWIFVLAGAFAKTTEAMGAIDATVAVARSTIPANYLPAGIFIASCFVSLSIGTSVGTIVALTPVVTTLAGQIGCDTVWMVAIVVGGAFFGDNLSFISDTTIAATRTQGCSMADKFRMNIRIAGPAALIVAVLYIFIGKSGAAIPGSGPIDWVLLIPYILVIVLAISGVDVSLVLTIGLIVNAIIGFAGGGLTWSGYLESIGSGISGMGDLIIVTMMAGGMLELIKANGGLDYIVGKLTKKINGRRGAEFSIAALVSLANICTANNTIAIITTGGIAKDITAKYGIDPRRSASILDTFSCLIQGLLPYGAQLLMASGLAGVTSISIMGYLYYPFVLGAVAILAILIKRS